MKYKLLADISLLGSKGSIVYGTDIERAATLKEHKIELASRDNKITMSTTLFDILLHTGMIEKYTEPVTYTLENPPKNGTVYYRLYYYGVDPATWESSPFDWCSLFIGNCYATSEQAEQEHKKVKDIIAKNMA